jgi:hypothetical protein
MGNGDGLAGFEHGERGWIVLLDDHSRHVLKLESIVLVIAAQWCLRRRDSPERR